MDCTVKLEHDTTNPCIACLRNDAQIFTENEIQTEIIFAYKRFVKDHIDELKQTEINLCVECMEKLSDFNDFQRKCVESLQVLNGKTPVVVVEEKMESLDGIFSHLVKVEINPLDNDVKSEPEDVSEEDEEREEKHARRRIKPKKSLEAYCRVCCSIHPDSHKHAIDLHSRGFENGILTCLLCNHTFKDVQILIHHLDSSHKDFDQVKKCGKCEMTTRSREEFLKHVNKVHYKDRKRLYTCDFCDAVFYQSINLKYHTRRHLGGLKCNYCEKSFFDKGTYDDHIQVHKKRLEQIKFICDYCGYVAQFKPSLKKHMLHHHSTPEESVKCPMCDKLFKAKFILTKHLYNAHKQKTLPCCHCGKKFASNNTLKKHMNQVHGMSEAEKRLLRERDKPKERKYACDQCDMKFYQIGGLKKHMFSHTKTRPYNCHLCKAGYYTNDYLRKHYLRTHGIVYTAKEVRKICGLRYNVEDSD